MREIEFRGLVIDEPYTWVYGYIMPDNRIYQIKEPKNGCCGVGTFSVIPESISQYTGCRDKYNIKIYENDIVKDFDHGYCYQVRFINGCFMLVEEDLGTMECLHFYNLNTLEVIGNSFIKED